MKKIGKLRKNTFISPYVIETLPKLKKIAKFSNLKRKKALLQVGGNADVYKTLREIAHNTLKGKVKFNKFQKKRLKPYSGKLEKLCNFEKCKKRRKELIVQSGGFLPILIPAVASLISSLVAKNV